MHPHLPIPRQLLGDQVQVTCALGGETISRNAEGLNVDVGWVYSAVPHMPIAIEHGEAPSEYIILPCLPPAILSNVLPSRHQPPGATDCFDRPETRCDIAIDSSSEVMCCVGAIEINKVKYHASCSCDGANDIKKTIRIYASCYV